ncbi:MAG: efflux RND transporter permease subunit [Trueperaceae bacterium]|nr:MAG: efflux RND transporter permease subunit [Trueperaceae bacterium]
MIRSVIESSMKLRFVVLILSVGLLALGISQLRNMPADVLPELNPPLIEVQTEALGLSAEEVEELITVPLEADLLNGVAWLESISSTSITGLSSILMIFEPGTDIIRARQMVQERLTQAHALPNVSKPPTMLQPLSSTNRVMMIALSSETLSLIDMSVLARWNIKPKLMGVPGVANVSIWGQRKRQLQVLVDPEELHANDVTLHQIISTSGNALWVSPLSYLNASYPGTGGWIETPNQRLGIRHLLPITTPEDLAKVMVEGAESLNLGDVSTIVENHQPLIGDAMINDEPGLLLVIEKFPDTNTLDVVNGIEQAVADVTPGLPGVDFDTGIYRPASYIEQATSNVSMAIVFGGILVVLVLVAFSFSWRSALISIIAIPLSILSALLVLYVRGETLNVMVLAGLLVALAAVIDDAVLNVETIKLRLRQTQESGEGVPVAKVVLDAMLEVRGPMMFATILLLVTAIPLYVVDGMAGALLSPLTTTYALAVVTSLLVALVVTPALSLVLFANTPASSASEAPTVQDSPLTRRLQNVVSKGTIERPLGTLIIGGILVVLGLIALPQLRGESFLPTFKESNLIVRLVGEPGTSRRAMNETASQITAELRDVRGVDNVAAHIGRAVTSDEVVDVHSGEIWISLDPATDFNATVRAIEGVVAGYSDVARDTLTYLQEVTEGVDSKPNNTLTVRVFGDNIEALKAKADEVSQQIANLSGVASSQVDSLIEKPNVLIEVDLARAEQYGLKPGDVRRAAAALLSGIEVGNLFEEQKVFDVVVWGKPEIRSDVDSIRALQIDTPLGDQVRLDAVARVDIVPTFDAINRYRVSRYLDVVATVRGRNITAVARDVEAAVDRIDWPIEFHAELLNDYAERIAAGRNLLGFLIAAIVGVFLLQQAAFRSWRSAAVAFVSLLVAITGSVLAAFVVGNTTVGVVAGTMAIIALAARNGITLISHYGTYQLNGHQNLDSTLIERATREKIAPILTGILALAAVAIPLLILGNRAGLEVLTSISVTILGGLITTTFASLFLVPTLYLSVHAQPEEEFDFGPAEQWLPTTTTRGSSIHAADD